MSLELANVLNSSSIKEGKKILSFEGKGLKLDNEESASQIITEIKNITNLETLELKGNTLGIEAAKGIGKALETQPNLKHALWSDLFTGRLKSEIPEALRYLCNGVSAASAHLVELDLSDNAFGPTGMNGLIDFLSSPSCFQLKILKLNNNGLGVTGGKMLADSLMKNIESATTKNVPGIRLEIFVSGRGRLEDEGALALSKPFKAMGSLVEVHMPQNGINHRGITALAEAFLVNKKLRVLNLADNTFTKEGAFHMARAVKQLDLLEEINFEDCLVRSSGAKELSIAIKNNHNSLKILRLGGNEMNREAGEAIVKSISAKPNLITLDLNCNALGRDGINSIKTMMKNFQKLDALLSLSDNEEESDNDNDGDSDNSDDENQSDNSHAMNNFILDMRNMKTADVKAPMDTIDPETFLESPSPENLKKLCSKSGTALASHVLKEPQDVESAMSALMKVSIAYSEVDSDVMKMANLCADSLLSPIFTRDNLSSIACNQLLVSLGLIKSETKKKLKPANMRGSLALLDHCAKQKYFPKSSKEIIKFFLEKPEDNFQGCEDIRQKLLITLAS